MVPKFHGFIVITASGKPLTDAYSNVLLYKDAETAKKHAFTGDQVFCVVTAVQDQKKKEK